MSGAFSAEVHVEVLSFLEGLQQRFFSCQNKPFEREKETRR
jgi:hypothetical protein